MRPRSRARSAKRLPSSCTDWSSDLRARELPPRLLVDYERIYRARAGVAVAAVISGAICGGCRMSIRPQALQELRTATTLSNCENCGRFLYWQD